MKNLLNGTEKKLRDHNIEHFGQKEFLIPPMNSA